VQKYIKAIAFMSFTRVTTQIFNQIINSMQTSPLRN